jgi:hypothetical protein
MGRRRAMNEYEVVKEIICWVMGVILVLPFLMEAAMAFGKERRDWRESQKK